MNEAPLSEEQQQAFRAAMERSRSFMGAAKVAAFNGWTLGVIAAVSILFGFMSFTGLVMGVLLGVVAWNEFRGRRMIRSLNPAGFRLLGRNQLALMGLIILYCLVSIYRVGTGGTPDLADLEAVIGPTEDLVRQLSFLVYGLVILGTVIAQGLNARYYFRRGALLEGYLRETPAWIVELQRAGAGTD
ncbi:MAG: hypothetical protein ACE5GJ_05190 [Gemmatimonadota bacterium]